MIFGDLVGLKLPDICLTGEEKPQKNLTQKLALTGDRTRARCVTGAHATACSTVVDPNVVLFALTAEKKTNHPMRISRLIYSQNIFGLFILCKIE